MAIALLPDGDLVATGSAGPLYGSDFVTVKYSSSNGSEMWTEEYGGYPGEDEGADVTHVMAIDASGRIDVTGDSVGGSTAGTWRLKYSG